jgi:hypothetical protein
MYYPLILYKDIRPSVGLRWCLTAARRQVVKNDFLCLYSMGLQTPYHFYCTKFVLHDIKYFRPFPATQRTMWAICQAPSEQRIMGPTSSAPHGLRVKFIFHSPHLTTYFFII